MMSCLVIDDERLVRELLEDNIRQIPYLRLAGSCKNALEAAEFLQRDQVDLLFLDIRMPRISGLQLLQSLQTPPLVILVTAYEQYALEGFNLNVVDYLLKPFAFDRFLKACNRAHDLLKLRGRGVAGGVEEFFVHVEYTLVKVVVADIDYVEGLKDYIRIHLASAPRPVLTRMSMKSIEEKLPAAAFIRTHKSYLVATRRITAIKRDFVCLGPVEIPIGEAYKRNIDQIVNPGSSR
ncbi:LytR/AlgR family response regulator transcription factor [Puia sp. P3]|uniref:LytR/AlgR family response regulator transcription factor n=1 Tax=Puia sp. P3 TaxID=3423952 RepID=UPI003D671C58